MCQRLLISLCSLALAMGVAACDAGTTTDTGGGACSSESGCSSGYGCSDASLSTQSTCTAGGATWSALLTETTCVGAGETWGALLTEEDCVEAGYQWGEEDNGSACVPNNQKSCPCGGGLPDGIQTCTQDGAAYTPCDCGTSNTTPDAGVTEPDATDASLVGQACEPNGEEACDGDRAVVACSGGFWIVFDDCGVDGRCEDAVCLQECTPD
ncbi:MAG: hypothetical protein QF464_00650, partial [Myxococcota bacterium]|nr:hypothetical protein [Myxococcota bacterium]